MIVTPVLFPRVSDDEVMKFLHSSQAANGSNETNNVPFNVDPVPYLCQNVSACDYHFVNSSSIATLSISLITCL